MSVTQDYKENNLVTFTFTRAETVALRVAAMEVGESAASDSVILAAMGHDAEAQHCASLSNRLLSAYNKLGRKS